MRAEDRADQGHIIGAIKGTVVQVDIDADGEQAKITLHYDNGKQVILQSTSTGYGGETSIDVEDVYGY